jgi:hypothetical protein
MNVAKLTRKSAVDVWWSMVGWSDERWSVSGWRRASAVVNFSLVICFAVREGEKAFFSFFRLAVDSCVVIIRLDRNGKFWGS